MKRQEEIRVTSHWSLVLLLFCLLQPALVHSEPKADWEYYQKNGHRSPQWDPLIEAGFSSFESGNFDTAINFLERAKVVGCKDGLVFYKLAAHLELQGNFEGAIKMLQQAEPALRNRYPTHPASRQLSEHLGTLYYQMGKYDEALPRFLEAIRLQGENFLRLYLVGQMNRMKKNNQSAIAYFEKALQYETPPQIAGMRGLAQIELMKLYFDEKNDEKALEMANTILEKNPQNPTALSYRDNIEHRRAKEKERRSLQRIIENQ